MNVFFARRVEGPQQLARRADAVPKRAWRRLVDFFWSAPPREPQANPPESAAWAYRLTNYRHLRAAGVACVVAPPRGTAGISCHLDLQAVEPALLAPGDVVLVEPGQVIPIDVVILEGKARIDESPVIGMTIRQPRAVAAGTTVMRGSIVITGQVAAEVLAPRGHPLDRIDQGRKWDLFEKTPIVGRYSPLRLESNDA
jgi:hypothetical protein